MIELPEIIKINREWVKRQIDSTRESIGRNVSFFTATRTACTLCAPSGYYNSAMDSTIYFNCPVCSGTYWLNSLAETVVLARVHWTNDEAIDTTPGGKFFIGDATVTVDPSYRVLAEDTQNESGKVVVDGHDMQIIKIIPLGAPEPNRYRVVLKNQGERPS